MVLGEQEGNRRPAPYNATTRQKDTFRRALLTAMGDVIPAVTFRIAIAEVVIEVI